MLTIDKVLKMFPLHPGKFWQSPLIALVIIAKVEKIIVKTINITTELKI